MASASISHGNHLEWFMHKCAPKKPASSILSSQPTYNVAPIPGSICPPLVTIHNWSVGRGIVTHRWADSDSCAFLKNDRVSSDHTTGSEDCFPVIRSSSGDNVTALLGITFARALYALLKDRRPLTVLGVLHVLRVEILNGSARRDPCCHIQPSTD